MVARARRVFRMFESKPSTVPRRSHDAQKLADNMAHCARACCIGPRRSETGFTRLTMRERRAVIAARADAAAERRATTSHPDP